MSLRQALSILALVAGLGLSGCGATPATPAGGVAAKAGINGVVHGGQQGIGYATLQLYTVGVTGDGTAATPMLTQTVMSDAVGNFTITGDYSCTTSNATQVYLTATGGNPTSYSTNPNLAMMVALGPCSALTPNTYVTINELTTVAAVAALQPYMTGIAAIGSAPSDASALAAAFTLAGEFVNTATGASPGVGVPSGYTVPSAEIDTLGDVMSACINSSGGTAGQNNGCGNLFSLTTVNNVAPTDTVGALLNIANNPTLNTMQLFYTAPTVAPFQPTLSAPPANFQIALQATGQSTAYLNFSANTLSFGSTAVGYTSASQTVFLVNVGSAPTTLNSLALAGDNPGDFAYTTNCGFTLQVNESCSVTLTASPQSGGSRSASLVVISNTYKSPQSIALSVTGVMPGPGPVTLSASSLSFYELGVQQIVTVMNAGTQAVAISSIKLSNSSNWSEADNCGSLLSGQSVCYVVLSATTAGASLSGTLTLTDSDTVDAQTVALATYMPYTTVQNFGYVNSSVHSLAQFNDNVYLGTPYGTPLYGYLLWFQGPDTSDLQLSNYNFSEYLNGNFYQGCSVKNGGYCTLYVTFAPNSTGYRYTLATDIKGVNLLFKGIGGGSGAYFFPTTYTSFGWSASVGGPGQAGSVTYANPSPSNATASVSVSGANAADFTVGTSNTYSCSGNGNGPASLPTCQVPVTFAPMGYGSRQAVLTLTSADTTQVILLQGTGTYAGATAVVLPNSFGEVQVGTSSSTQLALIKFPNEDPGYVQTSGPFTVAGVSPGQGNLCAQGMYDCGFNVSFTPAAQGPATGAIVAVDSVTGASTSFALFGTGVAAGAASLGLAPSSLTFSPRSVGSTSPQQTITVTNTGAAAITLTGVSLTGTNPGDYSETTTCTNATLQVNGTCTISVTNTPTFTGMSSANVSIAVQYWATPNTVALSGQGQ